MKSLQFFLIAIASLMLTTQALAFPRPERGSQPDPMRPMNLKKAFNDPYFTTDYDFRGIVALSNCSGSLIRLRGSQPDDNALVLTNGHCLPGMIPPGQHITRKPVRRRFRLLGQNGRAVGTVRAKEILLWNHDGNRYGDLHFARDLSPNCPALSNSTPAPGHKICGFEHAD